MARKTVRRASKQSSPSGSARSRKKAGAKKGSKRGAQRKAASRKKTASKPKAAPEKKTGSKRKAASKKAASKKKSAAAKSAPAKRREPSGKKAATGKKPATGKQAAKKAAPARGRPAAKQAAKRKASKKKAAAAKAPRKPARRTGTRGPVQPRSSSRAPRWPTGPRPIPERELMTDDAEELNLALAEFEEGVRNVDDADVEYAAKKGPGKLASLARDIPQPLRELWADLKAMVSCVRDYWTGTYREIPWKSIAAMTGAIVYFVSPIDVIPDFIPLIGYVDDAAVISLALKWVADDLAAYRRWKEGVEASGTAATE